MVYCRLVLFIGEALFGVTHSVIGRIYATCLELVQPVCKEWIGVPI